MTSPLSVVSNPLPRPCRPEYLRLELAIVFRWLQSSVKLIGLRAVVSEADRAAWRWAVIVGKTDRSTASKQHKRGASGAKAWVVGRTDRSSYQYEL